MERRFAVIAAISVIAGTITGCGSLVIPNADADVAAVASKANAVANEVGGPAGFGGTMMNGYVAHAPGQMGFRNQADLAAEGATIMLRLHNDTAEDCTFRLAYLVHHLGPDEQVMNVDVEGGETVSVDIPCAEIVGMGRLDMPGSTACVTVGGEEIDNMMTVPGFLGLDYDCGDVYEHFFMHDLEDLDGDGNTEEFIVTSESLNAHLRNGGPTGHHHGVGAGMMGHHF